MHVTSPEFASGEKIPDRFSQYHDNVSPPLDFHDVPRGTQSLALIVEDPDAPHGTFTHWVLFNIHRDLRGLRENHLPPNIRHGRNSAGDAAYAGPKPPDGEHRYFFRLYALDRLLDVADGASREDVELAMSGHVLAEAELMGRYTTPPPTV